jgi:CRP-like cAMP-binding protein
LVFTQDELACRLGGVSHFRRLPLEALKAIVSAGQVRRAEAGALIFREAEPCAGLFVLLAGKVHLSKLSPAGQVSILAVVEPVIMFNEVAALDGGPNPATAAAVEDCVLWNTSCAGLQAILERHPQIGLGLLKVLATRNRMLVSHFEDLSFRSVLARTAKLLLDLSQDGQKAVDRRQHTNRELAARVVTVPEPLSRSLRVLHQGGYIVLSRDSIVVNQPAELARVAQIGPLAGPG